MTAPAIDALPARGRSMRVRQRAPVALVERSVARPARVATIERPRLTGLLRSSAGRPLVTLIAPAGYGKTTLLGAWADCDERPFAWVTLDREDNDPACLDASVELALESVEPSPSVLVLDDLQALCEPEAHAALSALFARLAPQVTLALASRTPAPLPVARMRAQGLVFELGPQDLAMDRGESAAMLALAGVELDSGDVMRLLDGTEGWPAALALGSLMLAGPGAAGGAEGFCGADRLVAEYVREEILDALAPDERLLALETSVLETLTGPVCDWVLERGDCAAALSELCREHGLLIPLARTDDRFRHHRLLAQTLRAELQRLAPERAAELHRRAGDWYRTAGDDDLAVSHAVRAGDAIKAGEQVWRGTARAMSHGAKATVERWLTLFTEAERVATPTLALAVASTQLASGQGHLVEHWAHVAATPREPASGVEAGVLLMRAALARDGLARMQADALRARELVEEASPGWAAGCLLAGTAQRLSGDDGSEGVALLREGARAAAVTSPDIHALCLTQLALPSLAQEGWEEAGSLITRARAQVERHGLGAYPTAALVLAASALVRAHRGRVEEAQCDLREARQLRARLTDFAAWYEVELDVVLARAAIRLSDLTGARGLLVAASHTSRRLGAAPMLQAWLDQSWAQLDAVTGPASAPSLSLTTAELRILRFLPTHLSFREIAGRVHVSANTVKTQANAVYRKLDVSCRSDAVARARQLGLLDA